MDEKDPLREGSGPAPVVAPLVAVVGAGAAGFFAAISAARHGARVLLLDRRRKVGAKILISGGTRCNVTNERVEPSDFNTTSKPFVRNVLREFPPERVREFFEEWGVALKLEPTGKYFPTSDSARDVLAGLLRACEASGAELRREVLVTRVERVDGRFRLVTDAAPIVVDRVVLCTGGLSFPETGSDGMGYEFARAFGHRIERTSPALTPLVAASGAHAHLAGVALPATLTLWVDGRKEISRTGSLLFTHKGYSGPVAMDLSRHWIRRGREAATGIELRASFLPEMDAARVDEALLEESRRAPRRRVAHVLGGWLPQRLAETIAEAAGVDVDCSLAELRRDARWRLVEFLTHHLLPVTDVMGYRKAEVTAGGVALDEVSAKTLESRLQPGLFFAGEILDVDGYIGGFNFQWAWSSGWVAGRAAAR